MEYQAALRRARNMATPKKDAAVVWKGNTYHATMDYREDSPNVVIIVESEHKSALQNR